MKTSLLAALLFSFALPSAALATNLQCSPYDAVYVPSPAMPREDGIHDTITFEQDKCVSTPCVAAKIYLNTLNREEQLLTRTLLHYGCGGTGWTCSAALVPDDPKIKSVVFDILAITEDFKTADVLGNGGQMPYALVFPGIDRRFRYFHWKDARNSVETSPDAKLPLEIEVKNYTSPLWVFSRCTK